MLWSIWVKTNLKEKEKSEINEKLYIYSCYQKVLERRGKVDGYSLILHVDKLIIQREAVLCIQDSATSTQDLFYCIA